MMALAVIRAIGEVEVTALLTTVNEEADRVAMHAVRRKLLQAQTERLGLPLITIDIPSPCSNDVYEQRMSRAIATTQADGISQMIFGDLFLQDVREYREQMFAETGITPIFPIWGIPTDQLAKQMIESGVRAIVTCVDPTKLPAEFAGRNFDEKLIDDMPPNVDPCGENGEFHTFVWDGPGFSSPIAVQTGEVVERDGFIFCDVLGATSPAME